MTSPLTFQDVILALQEYWTKNGCILWQPYHTEVGAGTMNPASVLRVLGPEPWNVAYVEPSIRPDDGRYGENPNRWQHYYQFQVILKPDPGNPQELFLNSLVALGIDPAEHDIRFVEDNWEQPALGAWGLGWEVWLDGQEITQYTYFQQSGGHALDPVSVEITYGIERILIALQGIDNFLDIRWNERLTYGQISLQAEREFCGYNFEVADVDRQRRLFQEYVAEADACLAAGLVLPAHDYVLKCSHAFNLLDARGAVGVADRAALFGRMRDLSRRVADAYLAQREALGYPWLERPDHAPEPVPPPDPEPAPSIPAPFLFEVGTEELPASDLSSALGQLAEAVGPMLSDIRLDHGAVRVSGTPRRLVVSVDELAPVQSDVVSLVKGPPADRAFDSNGKATAAGQGFARSKGIPVESLEIRAIDGGQYAVAEIREAGRPADAVLAQALPALVAGLKFERSMRWNASGVSFSRPIRWLLALHGRHVVPVEYAGVRAGRTTRLLRFDPQECRAVDDPAAYFEALHAAGIVLDFEERKAAIVGEASRLARQAGGSIPADDGLLAEVTNLVEAPTPLRGAFDGGFLALPREVLVAVMKKHQRYFPVEQDGRLLPSFIAVRNGGAAHLETVRQGNEHVLKARFADAAYFVRRDREKRLEDFLPRLATLVFQAGLGSMLDKSRRVEALTDGLASMIGLAETGRQVAARAAHLCKADLATQMVVEMTSLQGEIGRVYALEDGEPAAVADVIFEHYLPRFAGDRLPSSPESLTVGLADRLDTLMGLFAAGLQPTGARDPFALRRSAIGLAQALNGRGVRFDLRAALTLAAGLQPIPIPDGSVEDCLSFITARQHALMLAEGHRYDVVDAVLAEQGHDPAGAAQAVEALEREVTQPGWPGTLQAYARCARITRDQPAIHPVDRTRLVEPGEKTLLHALETAENVLRDPGSVDDFLAAFRPMIPAITRFFEDVLVMTDDLALRETRLGMLQRIVALAAGVADLSRLEGF